jgi:hypothetical protein
MFCEPHGMGNEEFYRTRPLGYADPLLPAWMPWAGINQQFHEIGASARNNTPGLDSVSPYVAAKGPGTGSITESAGNK